MRSLAGLEGAIAAGHAANRRRLCGARVTRRHDRDASRARSRYRDARDGMLAVPQPRRLSAADRLTRRWLVRRYSLARRWLVRRWRLGDTRLESFKRPQLAAVYMHGSQLLLGHGDRESPVALGPAGA